MKTPIEIRKIVDTHAQLSEKSCSPSLVELLLKIEDKVPLDYFELQKKYGDSNVGLVHFDQQTIEDLHFQKHDLSKGRSFLDRLQEEWKAGRIIGLYCVNPGDPDRNCHGWIVQNLTQDRIYLLSKYSEQGNGAGRRTAELDLPLQGPDQIEITDLLFYTTPSVSEG